MSIRTSALCLTTLISLWTLNQAQSDYPYTIDTLPKTASSGPVRFVKQKVMNEGNPESCAFGDFNGDDFMDIVSGNHWFEGPGFTVKHYFRLLSTVDLTTPDDMTVTLDVNGDGFDEVISGGHNFGLYCYMNPANNPNTPWTRVVIDAERPPDEHVDTTIAAGLPHTMGWHSGGLVDVDGDGKKEELLSTGVEAVEKNNMRWWKYVNNAWVKHDLGEKCNQWGSGMGDLNGDGRADVLCPDAWLEAPVNRLTGKWIKHDHLVDISNIPGDPLPKVKNSKGATSGHVTQIYTYDVNKDGLADMLMTSGHGNGVFWYQQAKTPGGEITFVQRIIDSSWYDCHNLEFQDIDGDGDPDMVSGKRYGIRGLPETRPNSVFWYELTPGAANPWKRHALTFNEKIGMGTKGDVRDFDHDGDMDILVTSMYSDGTNLFINQTDPVTIAPKRIDHAGPKSYMNLQVGSVDFLWPNKNGMSRRNAQGRLKLDQKLEAEVKR